MRMILTLLGDIIGLIAVFVMPFIFLLIFGA